MKQETLKEIKPKDIQRIISSTDAQTASIEIIELFTQCQEDMVNNFLSLIEEFKEKELPNRNVPYHYESEIASGLKYFEIFIKQKQTRLI
jgi:hypothetical protein